MPASTLSQIAYIFDHTLKLVFTAFCALPQASGKDVLSMAIFAGAGEPVQEPTLQTQDGSTETKHSALAFQVRD